MLVATMSSCHIYNKYELPKDNAIIGEYQKAIETPVDSSAFGNLGGLGRGPKLDKRGRSNRHAQSGGKGIC